MGRKYLSLALAGMATADHVPAGTMASNYGQFGSSGSWDSSYQDSLAQIQQAYDSMNSMFSGGPGAASAPEGNGYDSAPYGNTPYGYDGYDNSGVNNYNPYSAPEQPSQNFNSALTGGNSWNPNPESYQAPPQNAYAAPEANPYANPQQAFASPEGQYRPEAAFSQTDYNNPYNPYANPNPYANQNPYSNQNYNPAPQGPGSAPTYDQEASAYGGMSIDQGAPEIQEDCWQNITDRINGFFGDRFPTLPNGQSAYTDIEILNCYGCWCNREERFGNGMGEPRDAFDAICKFHHQAYECIEIDAEERGEVCDPVAVSAEGFRFKMELSFDQGRGGMNLQCDQAQNWCKQRVCEADLQYIKDFVRTALAGHRVRRDLFGHEDHIGADGLPTGYFDQKLECPLGGSLHTPHKKCCGAYPRRRVFKTDTLEDSTASYRQCCDLENGDNTGATDGAVYYPASQVCCNEHGVQNGATCELYNAL